MFNGVKAPKIRPEFFRLGACSPYATGLLAAYLGAGGSQKPTIYHDSVAELLGSSAANHGLLTNMDPPTDWVWEPELGRWAQDLDGSDDFIQLGAGAFNSAGDFSVSTWYKAASSGQFSAFIVFDNAGLISRGPGAGQVNPGILVGGTGYYVTTSLTAGTLYHIAVMRTGATRTLYLNGVPTAIPNTEAGYGLAGVYRIGSGYAAQKLGGTLFDIMIWNRALSAAEISALADRSNVMLSGLILPLRRRIFPAAAAPPTYTLAADSGAYVEAGTAAGLLASRIVGAGSGAYAEAGTAAGLLASHVLAATLGTYVESGTAMTPLASRLIAAGVGAYLLDGKAATLTYTPVGGAVGHIAYAAMRRNRA
jgi:hypothetical protein